MLSSKLFRINQVSRRGSCLFSSRKHESWRDDNDTDNLPKVKKRDGTIGNIDKNRGFMDYHRIPEPYRDPLERVFDWNEINYDSPQHDDIERTVQAARCMDCGKSLTHSLTHSLTFLLTHIKARHFVKLILAVR